MFKKNLLNIKSDKGFTMYDLAIALIIFTMFAALIGSLIVTTYKVQVNTEVDEVVTLYAIQIVEYIDKIGFDEVTNELSNTLPQQFGLPESITLNIQVSDYNPNQETEIYTKKVSVDLKYDFDGEQKNILINRLKIKEL